MTVTELIERLQELEDVEGENLVYIESNIHYTTNFTCELDDMGDVIIGID